MEITQARGFSLIEIAIALCIIALMLGSGLTLLSAQQEQIKIEETRSRLEETREALIGYAVSNGRLPCPASATSGGLESPVGGGNCTNFYNGFVPAATLGLAQIDEQGYAIDAWGVRLRYAVSSSNGNAYTTANGMSVVGISALLPDLQVCSTAVGITGSPPSCASGPPGTSLTSSPGIPAVLYSTGINGRPGGTGGTSIDEAANPNPKSTNNDRLFVSRALSSANEPGGEFDDQVTWLSTHILFNRMVQAGKLP